MTAPSATARISTWVTMAPERPHDRPRAMPTAKAVTAAAPMIVSTSSANAVGA